MKARYILIIATGSILLSSCGEREGQLLISKELPHYPSGSGLAYFRDHIYLMGDDAPYLLVLDTGLNPIDSISLFPGKGRIPKEEKNDPESLALLNPDNDPALLVLGSGSLPPNRDSCLVIYLDTKKERRYSLDTFYRRIRATGITDLNVEGATAIPGRICLSTRGHLNFRKNLLLITSRNFWENQQDADIRVVKAGYNADSTSFSGVSGLDYAAGTDELFLTVSTEKTTNAYDDGDIGKSFLWIIRDFSSKRRLVAMNPDRVIDLEEIDPRFAGHKIESVSVIRHTREHKVLVLVADDDRGGTVLFKLMISSR